MSPDPSPAYLLQIPGCGRPEWNPVIGRVGSSGSGGSFSVISGRGVAMLVAASLPKERKKIGTRKEVIRAEVLRG